MVSPTQATEAALAASSEKHTTRLAAEAARLEAALQTELGALGGKVQAQGAQLQGAMQRLREERGRAAAC